MLFLILASKYAFSFRFKSLHAIAIFSAQWAATRLWFAQGPRLQISASFKDLLLFLSLAA
jgi:hypothetical protein